MKRVSNLSNRGLRNVNGGNLVPGDPVSITKVTGHQSSSQRAILKNSRSLRVLEKTPHSSKLPEQKAADSVTLEPWQVDVPMRTLTQNQCCTTTALASGHTRPILSHGWSCPWHRDLEPQLPAPCLPCWGSSNSLPFQIFLKVPQKLLENTD